MRNILFWTSMATLIGCDGVKEPSDTTDDIDVPVPVTPTLTQMNQTPLMSMTMATVKRKIGATVTTPIPMFMYGCR